MNIQIKKCDICKTEYRSDSPRHWSDCVDKIVLDFKNHAGIQVSIEKDVCTWCGKKILMVIQEAIVKFERS